MTKHTKGPWLTDMSERGDLFRYVISFENKDGQPHYICRLSCNGNANAEADARLIASAPDLLDALRQWAHAEATNDAEELQNARSSRDAAIAKATGGQP